MLGLRPVCALISVTSRTLKSVSVQIHLPLKSRQLFINFGTIRQYQRPAANLKTMKLDTPEFHALFTPELSRLIELFQKHAYDLRIAGGAVRDLLMGKQPDDLDFATTATPEEMKAMFEMENVRMINRRGEKHGTITCRINDKENFEVTTLRIDVLTDGRHADVEYTKNWELDALRRDLTINSMFLGFDGMLYDYFGGQEDLKQRYVRFVGDARQRIQEDYLRILRYFRFYGRIAIEPNAHDEDTLKAIKEHMHGLQGISGERLWVELRKILAGNHVGDIMDVAVRLGMAPYVGLPENVNMDEFRHIWQNSHDLNPLPLTLIPALMRDEIEVHNLHERLKLSKNELQLGLFIIKHRGDDFGKDRLRYCQDLVCDAAGKEPKLKDKICELLKYRNCRDILTEFNNWIPPKFPVNGIRLLERGVPKGPALARTLDALRLKWKESGYTLTQEQLLDFLDEVRKPN